MADEATRLRRPADLFTGWLMGQKLQPAIMPFG
jgi:hypothetical protein